MRLLLDTHVLLWFLRDAEQIPNRIRLEIASEENECYVSYASAWEMAIKAGNGKLTLPISFGQLFPEGVEARGFDCLPIHFWHLQETMTLPKHHNDPFDRLLIAQAKVEQLTLVTGDAAFSKYQIPTLW